MMHLLPRRRDRGVGAAWVSSKDMEKILLEGVSSWGQSTFHLSVVRLHFSDEEVAVEAAGEAVAVDEAEAEASMQLLLITKVREATRYLLDRSRRGHSGGRTAAAAAEKEELPRKKANQGSWQPWRRRPFQYIYGTFFFSQFSLALSPSYCEKKLFKD